MVSPFLMIIFKSYCDFLKNNYSDHHVTGHHQWRTAGQKSYQAYTAKSYRDEGEKIFFFLFVLISK